MAQFAIDEVLTTGIQISGFIFDYSSSLGTPGQVLTSTTSGVMWQADSSIVDLSSLSGQIAATGTTLNNKINSLSGYVNNTFLSGVGVSNYVPRWSGTKQLVTGNLYDNGINVGIGTNNPNTKLRVNGSFSHRPSGSSNIQEYKNIVTYNLDNNGNGGYVVKTPFQIGSAYEMAIVHVKGYGYGNASLYDFKVVFYDYGPASAPVNYSLIDLGNDGTSKYLAKDANGYMQICFGNPTDTSKYYYRFTVDCITTKNVDDWSQNWGMYQTTGTNFGFASTGVYQLDSPVNFNVATNFVGIGTVSASRKLHAYIPTGPVMRLQSSGSNASIEFAPSLAGNGLYNWLVGAQQNISNAFEITPSTAINGTTYSNPALLITSAGNVGIGITGPEAKLDVSANAVDMAIFRSSGGSANDKRLTIKSGGDRVILNVSDNSNTGTARAYEFQIAGIPAMTLTALGRLGVGLTNPATLVGVGGAGSTSAASGITFGADASANLYRSAAGALKIDGSLGIGIDPVQKFQVDGAVGNPASVGTTQSGIFRISNTTDNAVLDFGIRAGGSGAWIQSTDETSLAANYPLLLNPNGGNVGIGTNNTDGKLTVLQPNTYSSFRSNSAGAYTYVSVGRSSSEFEMGVAGGVDQFFSGTAAGESILKSLAGKLHLGFGSAAPSITVNSINNVGIGTVGPVALLDLYYNGVINGPMLSIRSDFTATGKYAMIRFGDKTQTTLYQKGALIYEGVAGSARGRMHIALENTDGTGTVALSDARLTVSSNGNVGIGSTIPAYKLDVNGSAGFTNGITANIDSTSTSYFVGSNGSRPVIFQNNTASAYDFGFKFTDLNTFTLVGGNTLANPTTDLVSFTYDGKVGIGLTAPTSKLHVVETTATGTRIQLGSSIENALMNSGSTNNLLILNAPYGTNSSTTSNIGAKWGIKFVGSNEANQIDTVGKTSAIYAVSEDALGYNRGTSLAFYTNQLFDQTYAERMRIYHDGNIGIGVTNPSDKLQISGNISLTTSTGLAVPMLGILPTNAAYVGPYNTATDGNAPTLLLFNHGASVQQIYFYSSGRAAMVLNRQGRLNIAGNLGNTPPALLNVGPSSSVDAVSGMSFGNDASANLYRSAASTIKTDGSLVVNGNFNTNTTTVTTLNINAGSLPSIPSGSTITGFTYAVNNGNVSQINLVETRFQTGSDWTTASTRIQKRTDVTNQAYIEFNPSGASYGMALGVGANSNVEALRILSNGNVGIGTISPVTKLHIEQIQNAESLITLRNNRQDLGDVPIFGISAQNGITDVAKISFYRGGGGNAGYLAFSTKFDNASSLTEKVRINGVGNVGIGTINPSGKLSVDFAGVSAFNVCDSLSSNVRVTIGTVNIAAFTYGLIQTYQHNSDTAGVSPLNIQPFGGNIGIGRTNPTYTLDLSLGTISTNPNSFGYNVSGDATTNIGFCGYNFQLNNSTANASAYIRLARTSATIYLGLEIASQSRDGIRFLTNATTPVEVLRIDTLGDVGIGTNNPGALVNSNATYFRPNPSAKFLDLYSDTNEADINLISNNSGDGSGIGGIYFTRARAQTDAHLQVAAIKAIQVGTGGTLAGGKLYFYTKVNAAGTAEALPQMVINADGNVGIGITNPASKLHVSGVGATIMRLDAETLTSVAQFQAKANTDGVLIAGMYGPNPVAGTIFGANTSGAAFLGTTTLATVHPTLLAIGTSNTIPIILGTNGIERMRVQSDGYVGIGTTSVGNPLEVYGTSMDPSLTPGGASIFNVNSLGVELAVGRMVSAPFSLWLQGKHATVGGNLAYPIVLNPLGANVGIGTVSPTGVLTVQSNGNQLRLQTESGPGSYFANISSLYDSAHPFSITVANNSATATEFFAIYADAGGANNRSVFPNGNVGIGTTSPSGKLTVQGDIEVNYNSTTADSFVRRTFLTSHALVNRGSNIRFGLIDGGGLAGMTVYNTASSSSGYNSQFIGFNTHEGNVSTDERMRITQSGYVGIGTFNPNAMLQINGDELIYANVAGAVNSNKLIFGSFANVNAAAIYSQTTSASAGDLILAPVVSSVITERVRVKSDGKVGIGTDGPTTLLSVGGAGSTSAASGLTFGGDASANLYRISSSRIKTDGSLEAVVGIISPTITSLSGNIAATGSTLDTKINTLSGYANSTFLSGQGIANWTSRWNGTKELITGSIYDLGTGIGIGTTSPTSRLTVVQSVGTDSVLLDLQSNNDPGIRFGRSTYGSLIRHISATVDYIAFNCNGASLPSVAATAQVVIDENGNVGVGTTNPGSRLDVRFPTNPATDNGAGNNVLRVWTTAGYAANVGGAIGLGGEYSGGLFQSFGQIAGRKTNNTSGNNAGYLQFATTNNAGTMSEWMRIDSGGNVGIGTTNPVELLDIAASADNSAVAGPKVNFKKGATTKAVIGIGGNYLGQATQTDDLIFRNDAGNILFGFAGAEKMRIASNGNVGIATTLPGYSLQIGQNTSGNNTDYSLGILRHGTLSFPGSWTSNPAFKIIDLVDGGPSNVDINGIINLELPRFQASDTNSEKASLFTITYDSALGPLRVDGKGNTWIGYDRAATGINTSTFSSLIYGGLAVGSNYQTTTLSNGQAIFEGNVGVGITAPNAKIHVLAADAATADLARFQQTNQGNLLIQSQQGNQSLGGSNGILFSNALGRIGFRTNASVGDAQVIINANGNVGINTTNPSSRLHIIQTSSNNALLLDSDSSSIYSTLEFNVSGVLKGQVFADSSDNSLFVRTNTLTGALKFGAANAERMRIDTSGNVGINTTNPIAKFVVNGGTVNTATYTSSQARIADGSLHLMKTAAGGIFESIRAMNVDTTAGTTVRVLAAATSDPFNNANGGKVFIDAIRTATNMDLAFSLNDVAGAAAVERVRFMGNGNVGIGITTPLQKLQVDGVVGSPASVGVTQSGIFRISNTTDNAVLDFGIRIAGSGAWIQSTDETSLAANYPLLLNPNGGNVGIGTLVPADKLHVIGNIRINGGDILNWGGQAFIQTIGANDMFFRPNSTFRMILTAVGNLGLGVLAPTTLLSVGGAGSTLPASGITFGEDASANLYRSAAGTLKTDGRLNIVGDASDSTPDLFFNGAGGFGSAGGQVRAWSPNNTTLSWYWDNTQFTYNNFPLRIVDGSSNVLVYFSATANSYVNGGNLGVGTSTPSGKLHVVSTVAGATVLRADGTNGTLFSVVDDLSDSLMSVNNSAGLPVLEVFADDRVVAGQYGSGDFVLVNNKVGIGTSNPSYKLDVRGSGVNARVGLMEFGTWPLDATYIYLQNNSLSLIGANYGFLQGPAGETFVNAAAGQTLHFRIGNSEKWAVTSAGILQSDGAQTIRTSTGPLTLATNAADGHIILSPNGAGNVGIGTTIPDAKLSINKGATNQLLALNMSNNTIKYSLYVDQDNNGSNSFSIFDTTNSQTAIKYLPTGNGSWQLYTNNVVRLHIDNVGKVGIGGTTAPTNTLQVVGQIAIKGDESADNVKMLIQASDNSNRYTIKTDLDGTTTNDLLIFRSNTVDNMLVLKGNGNVGVGTTNPTHKLEVFNTANSQTYVRINNQNSGTSAYAGVDLQAYGGGWQVRVPASTTFANPLIFSFNESEKARITYDGKFGIGIDAPTTLLSVGPVGSTLPASGLTFGGDASANLYRSAASTIKTDGNLVVAGATSFNNHKYDSKTVTLTTASYTTVLTVNLTAHTSCYVKIGAFGDWGNHSAVAFVSELFIQNGNNAGYGEPGTIITAHDNTRGPAGDKIDIQIVDPLVAGTQNFLIQLKLISSTSGTFSSLITYHVMGQQASVT